MHQSLGYGNAWDCLDRCQSSGIKGFPEHLGYKEATACEWSRAKGECKVFTGQIEYPVGKSTKNSESMCYIFKKDGRCFRLFKLSR